MLTQTSKITRVCSAICNAVRQCHCIQINVDVYH